MSMTHLDPNSQEYRERCGPPVGNGRIPTEQEQGAVGCWNFPNCKNLIARECDDFDYDTRRTSWVIVDGGYECDCGNFACNEKNCGEKSVKVCGECCQGGP